MTARDMAALIGRTGVVRTGPFQVRVTVLDVKQAYGEMHYQVRPLEGSGVAWVTGATFRLGDV